MAIIVNTNMSALKTQKNLNNASNSLQTALERMSTGLKINKAAEPVPFCINLKGQLAFLNIPTGL